MDKHTHTHLLNKADLWSKNSSNLTNDTMSSLFFHCRTLILNCIDKVVVDTLRFVSAQCFAFFIEIFSV